ncbi:unnamed protein product [Merluccius merluccius]
MDLMRLWKNTEEETEEVCVRAPSQTASALRPLSLLILTMSVSVSSDLCVRVHEDVNVTKITERQQVLRESLQKGEPKSLGVSQVMLGLLVMTYSSPLCFTELSEVLNTGTPWWSGLVFITAGVTAIIAEKHCTIKSLRLCLLVTLLSVLVSLMAAVVYIIDLVQNPELPCGQMSYGRLSRGVKSSLFLFTLTQTAVSSTFCFLLYRIKHTFCQYSVGPLP